MIKFFENYITVIVDIYRPKDREERKEMLWIGMYLNVKLYHFNVDKVGKRSFILLEIIWHSIYYKVKLFAMMIGKILFKEARTKMGVLILVDIWNKRYFSIDKPIAWNFV